MLSKTLRPLLVVGALLTTTPASAQYFLEDLETRSNVNNGDVLFRRPSFSGTTGILLDAAPNDSLISTTRAFSGAKSLKLAWKFKDTPPAERPYTWVRLTTSTQADSTLLNPTIPTTKGYVEFKIFLEGDKSVYVSLGVRETNHTAALGANSGTTAGTIEWIGATAISSGGHQPIGKTLVPGSWQTVGFLVDTDLTDPSDNDPIQPFTGNGVLASTTGFATLESLAITPVNLNDKGPYTMYVDDLFIAVDPKTLTGNITLADCATPSPIPIEFRPTNGDPTFVRTVLPDGNGDFSVKVPAGTYHVGVKTGNTLRKVIPGLAVTSNTTLPSVNLLGGDANNDNSVDVLDLDALIASFDKCQGDEGFLSGTDFNCDGCTDVLDLDVLIAHFDQIGDDFPGGA